jgi:hypothetical protein
VLVDFGPAMTYKTGCCLQGPCVAWQVNRSKRGGVALDSGDNLHIKLKGGEFLVQLSDCQLLKRTLLYEVTYIARDPFWFVCN